MSTHNTPLFKRFINSYQWTLLVRLISIPIGLGLSIVLTRGLGPKDYGIYATILSFTVLVPVFLNLGYERIIQVFIPQFNSIENEKGKIPYLLKKLVTRRLVILCALSVGIFFLSPIVSNRIGKPELAFYFRLSIPFILLSQVGTLFNSVPSALLQVREVSIFEIIKQAGTLVFSFLVLYKGFGISGLISVSILSSAVGVVVMFRIYRKYIHCKPLSFDLKPITHFGIIAWVTVLVTTLLGKEIDIVLMNFFKIPDDNIGYYHLGFFLSAKIGILAVGTGPLMQSAMAEAYKTQGTKTLGKLWVISIKFVSMLVFPFVPFVAYYGKNIIGIIYPAEFVGAVLFLQLFLIFRLIYDFTGGSFSGSVFYVLGHEKIALYSAVCAGAMNLILDIILIPTYGALGAVIATLFSMCSVAIVQACIIKRMVNALPPFLFLLKLVCAFTLALAVCTMIHLQGLISLFLVFILYSVVGVTLLKLLRPLSAEDKEFARVHYPISYSIVRLF